MSTGDVYAQPLPVIGPLSAPRPVTAPGPYRCGCNPTTGASCRWCDGTAADEWEIEKAARDAQRKRDRLMRDPEYRAAWLSTFSDAVRADMAAAADRRYGPIPTPAAPAADGPRRTA